MVLWLYYIFVFGPPFALALSIYGAVHLWRWLRI